MKKENPVLWYWGGPSINSGARANQGLPALGWVVLEAGAELQKNQLGWSAGSARQEGGGRQGPGAGQDSTQP